ncbi:zonadhesin-like isoform X3 [Rana temporaria]|uniref:zonadhesin-like isoform X3 n=1 Tax=Rana temporaria TaxID=8407 RepID=UPI001AAD925D|nr:zonadhesin-like isoform X3 [Rana temporaria]
MRSLLILGGLVVCVLLVTPSNGGKTEYRDGGEKKSMDSGEPTVPAGPSERDRIGLPCCGWGEEDRCRVCPDSNARVQPPSDDITDDDQKSMDSGDPTVPAEPSEIPIEEIPIEEKPAQLPCCRWPLRKPCKKCSGWGSSVESIEITDNDDQKNSMDSEDLTVPAEPSEIPIEKTTAQLPCCRWPRREPCMKCSGWGSSVESLEITDNDDQKNSMDSRDLTVPAGPSEIPIEEKPAQLPCCRWPLRKPCKKCSGWGSSVESLEITDNDDQKNSMDSEDLTVPAEPSEIPIEEKPAQLPCCRWPRREPCRSCNGWGSFFWPPSDRIPAYDQK